MREIKFRGFSKNNNEWVYGYLLVDSIGCTYIVTYFGCSITSCSDCGMPSMDYYEVIPETVGQYTGLKDKNGTSYYKICGMEEDAYCFGTREIGKEYISRGILRACAEKYYEVIGNIYENPELLEVSE